MLRCLFRDRLPRSVISVCLALAGALALSGTASAGHAGQTHVRSLHITEDSHPYTTWHCARQPISVRALGRGLEVVLNGESRWLTQAMSASGARFVAPGDPDTEFWNKGSLASVTWSGTALPVCVEDGALLTPFRASGNEPFWAVDYDGWQLRLSRPGVPDYDTGASVVHQSGGVTILQANDPDEDIRVTVTERLCADTMADLIRPYEVRLAWKGQVLDGCGGDASRLLLGARWMLKDVDGEPLTVPAWLEFLPDDRLVGSTGCNALTGRYTITGEGLSLEGVVTTRKGCAPKVMAQETTLTRMLSGVRHFSFSDAGSLILSTDESELTADEALTGLPR